MAYGATNDNQKIRSFKQLRSWRFARELAVFVYTICATFPVDEKFGLCSQMKRSSVSVAANIAEGFSRGGQRDKAHFYQISLGSLTETLNHVYIAQDLDFINEDQLGIIEEKVEDSHKMINGLIKSAPTRDT